MNWLEGIQNALQYIEAHITEQMDYADIAAQAYASSFHFQRLFSTLCGYSLGEYIRYRRLTLAGKELAVEKKKVLDVAVKYGYDSADSFSKAFTAFHGVSPSAAKKEGANLKVFSPLKITVSLEGGFSMNYEIKELPEMQLAVYGKRFPGAPTARFDMQKAFMMDGNCRFVRYALQGLADNTEDEYCVVSDVDDDGFFFGIGTKVKAFYLNDLKKHIGDYADLIRVVSIPKHKYLYAVTDGPYAMDHHIELYKQCVNEWLLDSGYQLADAPEITVRHMTQDRFVVEIYLPIE